MTVLTVRVTGRLNAAAVTQAGLRDVVSRWVGATLLYGERRLRLLVPKDTSAAARSFVSQQRGLVGSVHSPLAYVTVLDQGRRPGARQPPTQALAGWARRHGFEGSLFVLARAIGRRGIPAKRFFDQAQQDTQAYVPQLLRQTVRDVGRLWSGG